MDTLNMILEEKKAGFTAEKTEVWKNGVMMTGYKLNDGSKVSIVVYASIEDEEDLADYLIATYQQKKKTAPNEGDIENIYNKEYILKNVRPRLTDIKNVETLRGLGVVIRPYPDLGFVAYFAVSIGEMDANGSFASFQVMTSMLDALGISESELFTAATNNLAGIRSIRTYKEFIAERMPEMAEFIGDCDMWIVSNTDGFYGAAEVLDEDTLKYVEGTVRNDVPFCSVALLPSSVHEFLAVPFYEASDLQGLLGMVQSINANEEVISPLDILCNQVYILESGIMQAVDVDKLYKIA